MENLEPVNDSVESVVSEAVSAEDTAAVQAIPLSDISVSKRQMLIEFFAKGKRRKIISVILAVVIAFTAIFGVFNIVTRGEKINSKKVAENYNNNRSDSSVIYRNASKKELSLQMDELEALFVRLIEKIDIETMLYSDEGASFAGKLLGEYSGVSFTEANFSSLKKDYPDAYSLLISMQQSSASWEHIDIIPFGIETGNKEAFVKACSAFGSFFGDEMISMFLKAPTAYDDALVPLLESLHTGPMPSILGFLFKAGLTAEKRVEFFIEKALSVIEPLKKAPLTYICGVLPDLLINYERACNFINNSDIGLSLPTIEQVVDYLWGLLDVKYVPLDTDYITGLGKAKVTKSGHSSGKRVEITGDRDDIFIYLCYYISDHLTYADNFPAFEELITTTMKKIDRNGKSGKLLYSELTNKIIGVFVNIFAMNEPKTTNADVDALVNEHNSQNKDFSAVFKGFMNREGVARLIDTIDSVFVSFFAENNLEKMIFSDSFATFFCRFFCEFCSIELKDIPFDAMKYDFPDAYKYVKALQHDNKTWKDIGIIPFGITPGDKEAFLQACGAGAEYFGDMLALDMVISPTTYDEAFVTLIEAFHVTTAPDVKNFIFKHGADSTKIIEVILDMLVKIIEPLKEAPVSYICSILPDLIYSYGIASDCYAANPGMALTGFDLLPLNEFLNKVVSGTGIELQEYDFSKIIKLSSASVEESGDRTGKRMRLDGDREAVFTSLVEYVRSILNHPGNIDTLSSLVGEIFGISPAVISSFLLTFRFILG